MFFCKPSRVLISATITLTIAVIATISFICLAFIVLIIAQLITPIVINFVTLFLNEVLKTIFEFRERQISFNKQEKPLLVFFLVEWGVFGSIFMAGLALCYICSKLCDCVKNVTFWSNFWQNINLLGKLFPSPCQVWYHHSSTSLIREWGGTMNQRIPPAISIKHKQTL